MNSEYASGYGRGHETVNASNAVMCLANVVTICLFDQEISNLA